LKKGWKMENKHMGIILVALVAGLVIYKGMQYYFDDQMNDVVVVQSHIKLY